MQDNHLEIDAYIPAQVAERVKQAGIKKANMPLLTMIVLAMMAGAFIALGAIYFTYAITDTGLGASLTKIIGGVTFSLGLILVVIAGAELFTGNNMIVMAFASGDIGLRALLKNWAVVFCGNFIGAIVVVFAMLQTGLFEANQAMGAKAIAIANAKVALDPLEAFFRGIFCNALVCLAVWLCMAARSATDKVLVILFPISGFVALGFEHCIANMYLIPVGMMLGEGFAFGPLLQNLIPVTAGNVVGGSVFVALVYYICFIYPQKNKV